MKILVFFLLLTETLFSQVDAGSIQGIVKNQNGDPTPFVKVLLYENGTGETNILGGAFSDFDGQFKIVPLAEASYSMVLIDQSYEMDTLRIDSVDVKSGEVTRLGEIEMTSTPVIIECVTIEKRVLPGAIRLNASNAGDIKEEDIRMH